MKSLSSLSRIGHQVRQRFLLFQRKYGGGEQKHDEHGHHHYPNPGPPITLDYMPIPFQPYKQVYKEINKKFNTYLFICRFFDFSKILYYSIF